MTPAGERKHFQPHLFFFFSEFMKLCSRAKITLVTQLGKNLPAIQETQEMLVPSLG